MGFMDRLGSSLGKMAAKMQAEMDMINVYKGDYETLSNSELKSAYNELKVKQDSFWCTQEEKYRFKAIVQIMNERKGR